MKPVNFEYVRPSDLTGALTCLKDSVGVVKMIAGGQSLGPMLNMRLVQPDLVVDIAGLQELHQVEELDDCLVVGGCVTHADVEDMRLPDVTRGAMPYVARGIAYRAVRNRGTLGGSLTHADPAADWISILTALGASVTLRDACGERTVAVEEYMVGALEADLREGEILVAIRIPKLGASARWGYFKTCRKTGEFAQAIGAVVSDPEHERCRVVIGATEGPPIVLDDAGWSRCDNAGDWGSAIFGAAATVHALDDRLADPIERQVHVVAVRRAVEQAFQE